jgi:hypothetical protein
MTVAISSERAAKERLLLLLREKKRRQPIWMPLPGPQTMAYQSQADIIGYGGAAGGGKTDLAVGKSLTRHKKILVLRREATQLTGIIDRFFEVIGSRDGYNGAERILRNKYQGRPHDLLVFDEAANFLATQVRALLGWLRSVDPAQHCQALLTFNPPTNAEGRWIIDFFAPWLDTKHPNPAEPGELRYFAVVDGKDIECRDGKPFMHGNELITPMSRTFIPSRVSDNPYLYGTGYMATLQSLPEPLRSQMLNGDYQSGRLRFFNQRSELWWRMREALDPTNNTGIALPPDRELLADLCAPTWKLTGAAIQVEDREGIVKRIGRSPDYGSAIILALIETPKRAHLGRYGSGSHSGGHNPYGDVQGARDRQRGDYDPYT